MSVVVVVEPRADDLLIQIELVKKHLRVEHEDDDDLISLYAEAVAGWLDGPAGWLGRALGQQTLRVDGPPQCGAVLALPYPPVTEVVAISYSGADGADVIVPPSDYDVRANRVRLVGGSWPGAELSVEFVAGYTPATLPRAIQAAMLLMIGDLYAFRQTSVVGTISAEVKMTAAAEALLTPYRVWSL